jgi:hypothetical protein
MATNEGIVNLYFSNTQHVLLFIYWISCVRTNATSNQFRYVHYFYIHFLLTNLLQWFIWKFLIFKNPNICSLEISPIAFGASLKPPPFEVVHYKTCHAQAIVCLETMIRFDDSKGKPRAKPIKFLAHICKEHHSTRPLHVPLR